LDSQEYQPKKHVDFTEEDIKEYLQSLNEHIKSENYSISKNREKNMSFIEDYKIDTKKEKEILLSLTYKDFCYAVDNRKVKYSHEVLYVFCKRKRLDNWGSLKTVDIYIKLNMTKIARGNFMYVVSFHEKDKPLRYLFGDGDYF
jgi:23S rRNA pseudoU1915 N3-methylase RlmH